MTAPTRLSDRLRATVLNQAGVATLSCLFEPGGKLHGVGIPSPLYCLLCGHMRVWHDVAEAVVIVAAAETPAHPLIDLCEELTAEGMAD